MNDLNGYDIEDLHVGMMAVFSKTITEADIVLFAAVSGDTNAIHINEEYAATTPFKGRIAHGFLSASVISAAVRQPPARTRRIYLGQRLKFLAPVRLGDTAHAAVKVMEVIAERGRGVLHTSCKVKGVRIIDGEAQVKVDWSARRATKAAAQAIA